jgi:hypothetical protein
VPRGTSGVAFETLVRCPTCRDRVRVPLWKLLHWSNDQLNSGNRQGALKRGIFCLCHSNRQSNWWSHRYVELQFMLSCFRRELVASQEEWPGLKKRVNSKVPTRCRDCGEEIACTIETIRNNFVLPSPNSRAMNCFSRQCMAKAAIHNAWLEEEEAEARRLSLPKADRRLNPPAEPHVSYYYRFEDVRQACILHVVNMHEDEDSRKRGILAAIESYDLDLDPRARKSALGSFTPHLSCVKCHKHVTDYPLRDILANNPHSFQCACSGYKSKNLVLECKVRLQFTYSCANFNVLVDIYVQVLPLANPYSRYIPGSGTPEPCTVPLPRDRDAEIMFLRHCDGDHLVPPPTPPLPPLLILPSSACG